MAELFTLKEIFKDKIFRVPDFQRGYSWENDQLNDLWQDLDNIKGEKKHYTGMITLEKLKDFSEEDKWLSDKGFSNYHIIDGQQRLTTLIILINELLRGDGDILLDSKENWRKHFLYQEYKGTQSCFSYIFGYEKDDPSNEHFKTKILGKSSSAAELQSETLYTKNLDNAKKFFQDKLKNLSEDDKETLFKKVTQQLKFNYYEIENSEEIHVTFETMNNRGKTLSNLELLKNRIIYLSTLFNDEITRNKLRNDVNNVWKTIYRELGAIGKSIDEDLFLKDHWIMYFTYDRNISNPALNYLLKKEFVATRINTNENKLTEEHIGKYLDSLQKSIIEWCRIIRAEHDEIDVKVWIEKLDRLGWGAFRPLTMAVLLKEKDSEKVIEYLKVCERFNFLVFEVSDRAANIKNSYFYKLAKDYYDNEKDISSVISEIKDYTDGEEYGLFDMERFCSHIVEKYKKECGFYSWDGLKYLLWEYEMYLQEITGYEISLLGYEDYSHQKSSKKDITIEHIYPQTSTDNKYWKKNFRGKDCEIYRNSLGNLLLLSRGKNSALSNDSFDIKKEGYRTGSQSEIEIVEYKDWTKEAIIERGTKMLEFMQKRWNFKMSEKQITMLLTNK